MALSSQSRVEFHLMSLPCQYLPCFRIQCILIARCTVVLLDGLYAATEMMLNVRVSN